MYKDFEYVTNNKKDLPEQMYYVLRCGIVHSFSLVPDKTSIGNGGRERSILLNHNKNNDGYTHLKAYTENSYDSVVFTAETYATDIEKLVDMIFTKIVRQDSVVEKKIIKYWETHPPISALKF